MSNDNDYTKQCTFCKNKILMSKKSGGWLPYNLNNGPHDCKSIEEADKQNVKEKMKEIETENQRKQITLEMVQKKLESIGIIINVERLMSDEK